MKKLLVLRVAGRNSAAIIAIATSLKIPQVCWPLAERSRVSQHLNVVVARMRAPERPIRERKDILPR